MSVSLYLCDASHPIIHVCEQITHACEHVASVTQLPTSDLNFQALTTHCCCWAGLSSACQLPKIGFGLGFVGPFSFLIFCQLPKIASRPWWFALWCPGADLILDEKDMYPIPSSSHAAAVLWQQTSRSIKVNASVDEIDVGVSLVAWVRK